MNLAKRVKLAVKMVLNESVLPAIGGSVDVDDWKFRSLSESVVDRDMSEYKFENALNICHYFSVSNPLAKWVVDINKDFVIGNGITYETKNEKVKAILDRFWFDPYNNWPIKQHSKIRELGLYGEQAYSIAVNENNGTVRVGYIDPLVIDKVITSPVNIEDFQKLKIKVAPGEPDKFYDIVRFNDETETLEGDAFFFKINSVSNATRGISDLMSLIDWLDMFDQTLMSEVDRVRLIKSFVWDVLLKGFTDDQIRAWVKENGTPPKPGSVRAHNENAEWTAVTPDLKTADTTSLLEFILAYMLGGAGIPGHFYGFGQQTNKSTAETMDMPFLKRLEARQNYVKWMISYIFEFVIDMAVKYNQEIKDKDGKGLGQLGQKEDRSFDVILPEPSSKDIESLTKSLSEIVNSLTVATQNEWISDRTASSIYTTILSEIGKEVDIDEEEKTIKEEGSEKETDIYKKTPIPEEIEDA